MNPATLRQWGALVRSKRVEANLTQDELAANSGLDQATISRLERGLVAPTDDVKVKTARALGSPVIDLFPYPDVEAAAS